MYYYYSYLTNDQQSPFSLKDGSYSYKIGVPGFTKEDISANIEDQDVLVLKGASAEYGDFEKIVYLPENLDVSTVEIFVKNGVLEVKGKEKKKYSRKINIS